jgi:NitT/TauT family transport system permease protein
VFSAIALAFTLGVVLALFVYFVPVFETALYGRIAPFLNSFSGVGWAFLSLIWFGINSGSVIFCATIALLPITLINVGAGLKAMDAEIVEMSVSYSRDPLRRITLVILPLLYPYMLATLRLLFSISWQVVLVAELLCGTGGLGTLISISRQRFATDFILAIALLIFAVVYLVDRVAFAGIQQRLRKIYHA